MVHVCSPMSQSGVAVMKAAHITPQPRLVKTAEKASQAAIARRTRRTPVKTTHQLNPRQLTAGSRSEESKEGERGEGGGGGEGEVGMTTGPRGLDREKLTSILKAYGEYPAKYRAFIWRSLLQLPSNHAAYSALLERGTHKAFANLHRDYPIKSRKLGRVLQRWEGSLLTLLSKCIPSVWNALDILMLV